MTGNESEGLSLPYVMRHTFGVVHAVILTLITFGLVVWFPSVSEWSFSMLGCIVLPTISAALTYFCSACVEYTCEGKVTPSAILRRVWMPPLGIFLVSLIILPLQMMQSARIGPLSMLIATSIVANGIVVWLLQVYSSSDSTSSPPPVVTTSSSGASPI